MLNFNVFAVIKGNRVVEKLSNTLWTTFKRSWDHQPVVLVQIFGQNASPQDFQHLQEQCVHKRSSDIQKMESSVMFTLFSYQRGLFRREKLLRRQDRRSGYDLRVLWTNNLMLHCCLLVETFTELLITMRYVSPSKIFIIGWKHSEMLLNYRKRSEVWKKSNGSTFWWKTKY